MLKAKIFAVLGGWEYEGEQLLGVFFDKGEAEAAAKKAQRFFDAVYVEEFIEGEISE